MAELYGHSSNDWRIEKIIHLKSIISSDGITDDLKDFAESVDEKYMPSIFKAFPDIGDFLDENDHTESIHEYFLLKDYTNLGMIFQIAAQVPSYYSDNSWSSGWGYYTTEWVYFHTIQESEKAAYLLSAKEHIKARKKFKERTK